MVVDRRGRKAWIVTQRGEGSDGEGFLVFASTQGKAKYAGHCALSCSFVDVLARRASHVDDMVAALYRDTRADPRLITWKPLLREAGFKSESDKHPCVSCDRYAMGVSILEPCPNCQRCLDCHCYCPISIRSQARNKTMKPHRLFVPSSCLSLGVFAPDGIAPSLYETLLAVLDSWHVTLVLFQRQNNPAERCFPSCDKYAYLGDLNHVSDALFSLEDCLVVEDGSDPDISMLGIQKLGCFLFPGLSEQEFNIMRTNALASLTGWTRHERFLGKDKPSLFSLMQVTHQD